MKLIILGSGTCVPSLKRHAPGYYFNACDKEFLIDCGSGTLLQLEKTGKSYRSIDTVFITHTHPDHVSDLLPFLHALMATPGFRREKRLTIVGPNDVKTFFENCVFSLLRRPRTFPFEMIQMEDKLALGDLFVFSCKTLHTENSVAYRFEAEGKSVVITGDCDFDQGLIQFAEGADLLTIECSYPDSLKVKGHLTPTECGIIGEKAQVKRLILTHLYPTDVPDEDTLRACKRAFNGDVRLAEDLMEIEII